MDHLLNPPSERLIRFRLKRKLIEGQMRLRVAELEELCERLVQELAGKNEHIRALQDKLRCAREIRWMALRTKRRQEDIIALIERLAVLTPAQVVDLLDKR